MYSNQLDITRWTVAPLQVDLSAMLLASPEIVFHALSDPEMMCDVFAWMERVAVLPQAPGAALGKGAMRACYLGNGLVLEEEIVDWQPPYGYVYRGIEATHPFGMRGHVGVLSFTPAGGGCRLVWQQYFDHNNVPAMRGQLIQSMEAAINSLIGRFGGHPDADETDIRLSVSAKSPRD